MLHELKIEPYFYASVIAGEKRFEIRKDDRSPRFSVGDRLRLREHAPENYFAHDPSPHYTGHECTVRVTFRTDFEQKTGYVVLGITDPI